jgi:uncharacterized protein (DUF1684 family)
MWVLIIIFLTSSPDITRVAELNTFATYEECQPERNRIQFAMAESYPHDSDFRIVCEFREQKPPKVLIRHVVEEGPFPDQAPELSAADSPLPTLQQISG